MSTPLISAAMTLSEMVPQIYKWFSKPSSQAQSSKMIAEKVVDIAKHVAQTNDPLAAVEILKKDPKALVEFQHAVIKCDQDLENALIKNRQDARARAVALAVAGRRNIRADLMTVAAVIGLIACVVSLVVCKNLISGESMCVITTVAGIFGSCLKDAYAFEFGSSRGSKEKDLATLLKNLN